MARIDRLKDEIGWLKLIFGALIAIDASLAGWLAQNYATASSVVVIAAIATMVIATFGVVRVNQLAYRAIRELEGG